MSQLVLVLTKKYSDFHSYCYIAKEVPQEFRLCFYRPIDGTLKTFYESKTKNKKVWSEGYVVQRYVKFMCYLSMKQK